MEATRLHNLILEELMELNDAIDAGDIVEVADALADILYVTAQQAVTLGFPVDALLREVQRSNMSKLGADGKPIYREDGKVLKGPNFSQPDIAKVLRCYS
jgi:predicted HAD superfamily Cof-like phosphohydrolase